MNVGQHVLSIVFLLNITVKNEELHDIFGQSWRFEFILIHDALIDPTTPTRIPFNSIFEAALVGACMRLHPRCRQVLAMISSRQYQTLIHFQFRHLNILRKLLHEILINFFIILKVFQSIFSWSISDFV
jgi:hypothetical protein